MGILFKAFKKCGTSCKRCRRRRSTNEYNEVSEIRGSMPVIVGMPAQPAGQYVIQEQARPEAQVSQNPARSNRQYVVVPAQANVIEHGNAIPGQPRMPQIGKVNYPRLD